MSVPFFRLRPAGGSGGGNLTPGSVTNSILANGAVTLAKTSLPSATDGQSIVYSASQNDWTWATAGLSANSVNNSELNAGSATNDYVLTADSTETSGIRWKINAPANSTITPAKIADITVGSGIAGKLLGFNSDNHAEFAIIDPFTVSDIGADEITGTMIADGAVDLAQLVYDGTAEAGKVLKIYSKAGGGLGLQIADDNSGSGGGGNVSYPINLATASNFSNDLPIAQGGTGASTAAAARANLGVQASGGTSTEAGDLPLVPIIDAQAEGHIGEYSGTSTGRPETGSGSGLVAKFSDDGQIAVDADEGTTWYRSHSTSIDANWSSIGTPSPALPVVTTIAQLRAVTDYQIVESTYAAGNPQQTARCIIARFPGGFGGHGYLCAIPPGGVGFWVVELPSASFTAADISSLWQTWNDAPLPGGGEFNQYIQRGGTYEKVPGGQTGLVLDLQISSTTIADAFVSHTYDSDTTSSEYSAEFYTTGSTVRESTRGHTHAIGSWAKTQIDTDQLVDGAVNAAKINDDLVITESDGTAVSRMKVPQLEDVELTGYTLVTTSNPAAGQVGFDTSTRTVVVRAAPGDETLLDEIVARDFEFSIQKTSSGQAASVRGVFSADPIELSGLLRGVLRADDLQSVGTLAANDTVKVTGHKAVYTKLDTIPPIGLGIGHGSSQANHLVKLNGSGSAFTAGSLESENLPTLLADINSINERLTLRQKTEPRDFGSTYSHSASASGVTAGRIRWQDTARLLTINPLAADDKLVEYFSVLGVDVELTSTNGAVIHSTVEAVVSNPAGTPAGAITVRLKNLAHHYSGDIRSGTVTIKTLGSFIGRGDTAVVQRDALDAGSGSAGQVLSRTSTGLAWVNQSSGGGGGDTFTAAEYSSKVFSTDYNRNATLAGLPAGDYYWDDTNKRLTINPASADTDLTTRTPAGARFELRGASGLRLDGIISSRPNNPAGAPAAAFTLQFDTAAQTFYQSSGFAASTANMVAYCHGKVASWDAMNSTVSGLFGSIDREMLDTTNSPSNGQVLGVGASLDSNDRRLVWVNQSSGGGTPADNSITHAMLMDGIIEQSNMADDSVGTDEIIDGSLRAAAFPTAADDISAINRHLNIAQRLRGRVFGNSYSRVTTGAGLATAGTFRYVESSRTLSITPLSADSELGSYFLPGVRFQLISVSNFNSITGRIQTITTNPAGAAATTVTAILEPATTIVSGNIGTSSIQIATQGAFIELGDNQVSLDQLLITGTQAAGSSLVVNSAGTGLTFSPARSAQILSNHQTTNGGSITTNSFTDAASLLALPSFEIENLNDMLDFVFTGVLYFNAGAIGSIGIEARLQYRYATTSAGLSTASWNTASIDLTGGLNDAELIFRSKIAAGGSGDGSFRDYMPTITAWGSLDSLTTGPAVGNHIEFRIQFRMPSNSGFNTVNSYYSWRQRVMICPASS